MLSTFSGRRNSIVVVPTDAGRDVVEGLVRVVDGHDHLRLLAACAQSTNENFGWINAADSLSGARSHRDVVELASRRWRGGRDSAVGGDAPRRLIYAPLSTLEVDGERAAAVRRDVGGDGAPLRTVGVIIKRDDHGQ